MKNARLWKSVLATLAGIGLLWGAMLQLDTRYVRAQEYQRDQHQVVRALTKIQIRQLQDESREIVRESRGRLSENDRRRLDQIAEEIGELRVGDAGP